MKTINLTQNKITLVDDIDYEKVSKFKWYAGKKQTQKYYAMRKIKKNNKRVVEYLARFILDAPNDLLVDHKNGDTLDNRRENLRLVTKRQNILNSSRYKNNLSGYKRVRYQYNRWIARIRVKGEGIFLGRFHTKEEAALAYNKAAIQYFGEFAKLNSIGEKII